MRLLAAIVAYLVGAAVLVLSLGVALEQALGPTDNWPARQAAAPAGATSVNAPAKAAATTPKAGGNSEASGPQQSRPARNAAVPPVPVARNTTPNAAPAIGPTGAGTTGQGIDAFAPPSFAQPFVPVESTTPAAGIPARGKTKTNKPLNLAPGKPQGRSADGYEPAGSPLDAQATQIENQPGATRRSEPRPQIFHAKPPQAWLDH